MVGTTSLDLVTAPLERDEQNSLTRRQRLGFTEMMRFVCSFAGVDAVEPPYLGLLRFARG